MFYAVLTPSVSLVILKCYHSFYRWLSRFLLLTLLHLLLFSYFNVLFVNALFEWTSLKNFILWLLIYPLHLLYIFFGFLSPASFTLMTTQFAHIRQRALLKRFESLNNLIEKKKNKSTSSILDLNKNLAYLATDIWRFSSFWAGPLSTHFASFIAIQCYLGYVAFFVRELSVFFKVLFVYGLLLVETFHWALIHQCAKVATGNRCLKKANAHFYKLVFLSSQQIGHLKNNQSSVFQIKAEWLQLHHRLHPFAVHLLDSYRITSKTFYLVSIYTALFFMIVFKNQRGKK